MKNSDSSNTHYRKITLFSSALFYWGIDE